MKVSTWPQHGYGWHTISPDGTWIPVTSNADGIIEYGPGRPMPVYQTAPETTGSILSQLRARADVLRAELAKVERMIAAGEGK